MHRSVAERFVTRLGLVLILCSFVGHACAASINNPARYFPLTKTFTSSQTVTCPPTAVWARVELWGPSGPGGGGSATLGGGGGGGGSYEQCLLPCSGGNIVLTIGTTAVGGVTGGSCTAGTNGTTDSAVQGPTTCWAGQGGTGVAGTCAGGAGGTTALAGSGNQVLQSAGLVGQPGSGASGGQGGQGALSGGNGGNAGQSGQNGLPGLAVFTFF